MSEREYQRCTRCVMDTTDKKITFDDKGICDWCNDYNCNILPSWNAIKNNPDALKQMAEEIRKAGEGQKYDCIIGMSGGMDSSYLCYVAKELMGLRPLLYVVETGWNLKVADKNIDCIAKGLKLDLIKDVVDWEEMKDLQRAFLYSQVPYQDFPQDHAIFASLYNYAVKHHIRYVLTGANNATECIRPPMEWVYINDLKFMRDVHKKFGKHPLKRFPTCSMFKYRIIYPIFKGMKRIAPLNMVDYDKNKAKVLLQEKYGWEPYTNKHYEDIFTRFYEGYYLPVKFGYDKRKCYLSNEILNGNISRDDALEQLEQDPYDPAQMEEDKRFIAEKLGMSVEEFDKIIAGEKKTYGDYRNSIGFVKFGIWALRVLGIEKKQFR